MKNSTRSISAINPVDTENTGDKHNSQHNRREAISQYHELTLCVVSEKNWDTKEDKGKSMMCVLYVLYVLRLAKRHISG